MADLKETIVNLWEKCNPAEPSPRYLITFMLFAITAFVIALILGAVFIP